MKRAQAWTTVRTIDLDRDQMLLMQGAAGTRVRVLYGSVWLTAESDEHDYFARTGEEVAVDDARSALIESLGVTRIEIHRPLPAHPVRDWMASLRTRASRWAARAGAAMGAAAAVAGSR